jgi:hypothetical protein
VTNGTVALQYLATRAVGIAKRGVVTSVRLNGYVNEVKLLTPGSGYVQASTTVTITGGGGTGATASAVVQGGAVVAVILTARGSNYNGNITVTINGVGTGATASGDVAYSYGYDLPPSATISAPNIANGINSQIIVDAFKTEAIVQAVVVNGAVAGISIIDAGVGYTYATLLVSGGDGKAIVEPILDSGKNITA